MPTEVFAERILRFIQTKGYEPQQLNELAEAMGIAQAEQGDFHAACKALMKTGRVVLGARNALTLPAPPGRIVGQFRSNPRGFGFVVPDEPNSHGDLFIPPDKTGGALMGDTVSARVLKRGRRSGQMVYEGNITEIIKRGQSRFVGELHRQLARWFVIPDGNTLHVPILVGDPGAKGAKVNDQVVFEITQYPDEGKDARGVIVKVLGSSGEPDVDTRSIIEQYQLPGEFSSAVLKDARKASQQFDPKKDANHREDLRDLTIITIDPVNARDFDDAISLTERRDGAVELGVHIADVAHFVREGSPLDDEARERSTSVYLPRLVIPMLPEILSNGVCSLQEREPRLAKSAFITYDKRGKVKKARLSNTVIRSAKRLTYEQASAVLAGKRGRISAKVVALLKRMESLAKLIQFRRVREGMLELDLPDVELVFDDAGHVVDTKPEDTSFSHKIIEMFMVEANEAVARLLTDIDVPHLRRVHDEPRQMAAGNLRRFLAVLGHPLPPKSDRFAVQALLDEVRNGDDAFAVNLAVLKSMKQAEYSPAHIGHFALASKAYSHFTSPIRRYPDLTIHRLVDRYVKGELKNASQRDQIPTERELAKLGKQCTNNEQRAESAERELKLVLLLRLLEKHKGDEFDGVVTGVANMGVFVQLTRFLIDGLLRFDHLADDWWEVDPSKGCVVGQRSGRRVTVGDRLKVVISRIHIPTRRLELALKTPPSQRGKSGRGSSKGKSKPSRRTQKTSTTASRRKKTRKRSPRRR